MPEKDRIAKALQCIRNSLSHQGRAPTVRELATCMGFSSPRSAAVLIEELVASGYVAKRENGRIQLREGEGSNSVSTVSVPIVGSAPCGAPLLAEENIEGHIRVDTRIATPPHRYFILHASGDSMNEAGIDDGDLVLVRSTPQAHDGDRVVALVDGESTIKVLRHAGHVAVLKPQSKNPEHRPIYASSEMQIQGVVLTTLPNYDGR